MTNFQVRQGDILLEKISEDDLPGDVEPVQEEKNQVVLAHGEETGHKHVVNSCDAVQVSVEGKRADQSDQDTFLIIDDDIATLVHDEHDRIKLSPGAYRVRTQNEYSPDRGSVQILD